MARRQPLRELLPAHLLLLTIGYGAAALAGQDEDGTLCLLAVRPVRRAAIATQKIAAMAIQAAVLAAAVAACVSTTDWMRAQVAVKRPQYWLSL